MSKIVCNCDLNTACSCYHTNDSPQEPDIQIPEENPVIVLNRKISEMRVFLRASSAEPKVLPICTHSLNEACACTNF